MVDKVVALLGALDATRLTLIVALAAVMVVGYTVHVLGRKGGRR